MIAHPPHLGWPNTHPAPRRHYRYRHEERAYRRIARVRRACILVSVGLLLGTAWLVFHHLGRAGFPRDAASGSRPLQSSRTVAPATRPR